MQPSSPPDICGLGLWLSLTRGFLYFVTFGFEDMLLFSHLWSPPHPANLDNKYVHTCIHTLGDYPFPTRQGSSWIGNSIYLCTVCNVHIVIGSLTANLVSTRQLRM
jgi:hypothetical protein